MSEAVSQDRLRAMIQTALGPLAHVLAQEGVVGVQTNPDGRVWVATHGLGEMATDLVLDVAQRESLIRLMASANGVECHAERPTIRTGILGTRQRFQGFLPPVVDAPAFIIRLPSARVFTLHDYVRQGVCTMEQADLMEWAVRAHKNILVAGAIRSGKTTLANALLQIMATMDERILTIEDHPELNCQAPNSLALYVTAGVRSMQQLVMDALASDPRRIVIGEIRDASAVDAVRAWNTGHPGGLCTVHANGPRETLTRLEQLMPRELVAYPQEEIGGAIQLIVYMEQTETGRRVASVTAVKGYTNGAYHFEHLA